MMLGEPKKVLHMGVVIFSQLLHQVGKQQVIEPINSHFLGKKV